MDDEVKKFISRFNVVVKDCERFTFFTRGIEFQQESIKKLEQLETEVSELKELIIKRSDNDSANFLLGLSSAADALAEELKMVIALKEDRAGDAWDHLIHAQGDISAAIKAHDNLRHLENYAEKLYALEQTIFPPQTFCSPGLIVKNSECSICKQDYGECDHIQGKAYMGELCGRIMRILSSENFH